MTADEFDYKKKQFQNALFLTAPVPEDTTFSDIFGFLQDGARIHGIKPEHFAEWALCVLIRMVGGHIRGKVNLEKFLKPYRVKKVPRG